jgi:hypothetical protein
MKKCDLSIKMAETWNGNLIFLLLQAESILEIYLIKIIYYNMLPLTSDRTRLEIMFRWTHDQPMKTSLEKSEHHLSRFIIESQT